MDRIVKTDVTELKLAFKRNEKCTVRFDVTNLMHTMSVAVSLSVSNSAFAFPTPFSLLPPLSTSSFSLYLARPSLLPPLSTPPDTVTVRSAMLPTGKASPEDLRRLFSSPGKHIFKDAILPISLVGPHVVSSLLRHVSKPLSLSISSLLQTALSGCRESDFSPSLLSLAIRSGDTKSVKIIIESGYSPHPSDRLIHDAAEINQVDLITILLSVFEKIDFGLTDSLGRTALHVASIKGNFESVRFLISIGFDPDLADSDGWTALHYAASGRYIETAELLINSSNYAKNIVNKNGDTPFKLAVEKGYSELYDSLHLGDVLHRAARVGDVREIKRCLADGAKVNSRDQNGWTPLHRASFKGRIECVKVLLNNGALADLVENNGRSPIQLAMEAGHLQIVLYLNSYYGAKVSGKIGKSFETGRSGLDCFKNHSSVVAMFCQEREIA